MTVGGVVAVAPFAVVPVSVAWVGISVTLRVVGVLRALYVLGNLIDPVARHGQIKVDRRRCLERGKMMPGD